MQVSVSDWPFFDRAQSRVRNKCIEITRFDMTMPVEEAEDATGMSRWAFKVHHKPSAAWFQYPQYFARALSTRFWSKVMEHDCGKNYVEVFIRKMESFGDALPEVHVYACPSGLHFRSRDHFIGGINTVHRSRSADQPFGRNGERAGSTTHIENRFASFDIRQVKELFSKYSLLAPHQNPDQQVISRSPMQY